MGPVDESQIIDRILYKYKHLVHKENESLEESLNQIILWIYSLEQQKTPDLFVLASILPPRQLDSLVHMFEGRSIQVPTKQEKDYLLSSALAYCLIKVLKYTTSDAVFVIKQRGYQVPSPRRLSRRVNLIEKKMGDVFKQKLKSITPEDLEKVMK